MSDVEREIVQAFPVARLLPDLFVDPGGKWSLYTHLGEFESGCLNRTWQDIPVDFLAPHEDALRWLPPNAFIALVPAYLSALLSQSTPDTLAFSIFLQFTRRNRWASTFDNRFSRLNNVQWLAILHVLEVIEEGWPELRYSETYKIKLDDALSDIRLLPIRSPQSWPEPAPETAEVTPLPPHHAALEGELRAAFPPQPLERSLFWDWNGPWSDYQGNQAFEAGCLGKTWNTLGPAFLACHKWALENMTARAFVALVPAYLAALLRHDMADTLTPGLVLFAMTHRDGCYDSSYKNSTDASVAILDTPQRRVVRSVLEVLAREHDAEINTIILGILDDWRLALENVPIRTGTHDDGAMKADIAVKSLLDEIHSAFPAEPMTSSLFENATSLWDYPAFVDGCLGHTWDSLSPAFVEVHHDALWWMPAAAFVAVLPAYLETLVHGDVEPLTFVLGSLIRNREWDAAPDEEMSDVGSSLNTMWRTIFDARMARLDDRQRQVVVHILEAITYQHHQAAQVFGRYVAAALESWKTPLPR